MQIVNGPEQALFIVSQCHRENVMRLLLSSYAPIRSMECFGLSRETASFTRRVCVCPQKRKLLRPVSHLPRLLRVFLALDRATVSPRIQVFHLNDQRLKVSTWLAVYEDDPD